MQGKDMTST